jgi:hypothetical protein
MALWFPIPMQHSVQDVQQGTANTTHLYTEDPVHRSLKTHGMAHLPLMEKQNCTELDNVAAVCLMSERIMYFKISSKHTQLNKSYLVG